MTTTTQPITETCARLYGMAVESCAKTTVSSSGDTDALAASIAAQSNAMAAQANNLTIFAIFLGVVAVVVTIGWGWLVKMWAERAARDAVNQWMRENAYTEFSKLMGEITPAWMDGTGRNGAPPPPLTQDQIEEGLGGEPAKDA